MNLPTILEATERLGSGYEFLLPVARTLDREFLENLIEGGRTDGAETHPQKSSMGCAIHLVPEALPALCQSRAGIIASGTATVEAAIMGMPFVMVYRVSSITYALGRPRVKLSHFAMVNLIATEEVVPELVQHEFTAENVVRELNRIIPDGPPREEMRRKLAQVVEALKSGAKDSKRPAERAADEVLKLVDRVSSSGA